MIINRGMIMAKDDDILKDVSDGEDEDLLDFDFDEDLLGKDEEKQEAKSESGDEEEIIELTDVVAKEKEPEAVEDDIEGLEELILEEEEGGEELAPLSEAEEETDLGEEIDLTELVEKAAVDDVGHAPDHPSGKAEEIGEDTVLMEKMEGALEEGPEEPFLDLEEEIKLDEGLQELVAEDEAEELGASFPEETGEGPGIEEPAEEILAGMPPVEGTVELKEEVAKEGALPISEERVEALLTKVVGDVVQRVASKVIPEVAERIIREEIDALKKSIVSEH
jgi:hypothetical protein